MKVYQTQNIRNVALAGHQGAGKTTLVEAMLHLTGLVEGKRGTVEQGNTQSDYDPLEKQRQISISASLFPLEIDDHKINVIDCPGFRDFVGEIKNAIRATELCLAVVDAESGAEVGTEFAWQFAQEYNVPLAILINKMDKERANFQTAMDSVAETFGASTIALTLPIGEGAAFKGVVDLLQMKAIYDEGGQKKIEEIPADMADAVAEARQALMEAAAEGDDDLTEKFLMEETLNEEDLKTGLREVIQSGLFIPVLAVSSEKEIGFTSLFHFIIKECPDPSQRAGFRGFSDSEKRDETELYKLDPEDKFSAYVFKTVNDDYVGRLSILKVVTGKAVGDSNLVNVTLDKIMKSGHLFTIKGKVIENIAELATGDIGCYAKLSEVHTGDTLAEVKGSTTVYAQTIMPRPTVGMAICAKNKSEEDRISMAIHRLLDADPTLTLERDALLHQTVLHGMGDTHIEVAVEKLQIAAKTEVEMRAPKVQYRETITKKAEGQGKYKKQSGGRGQFGDCHVRFEPLPRGGGFEFVWKIVGGAIPSNFQSSVEKGIRESLDKGLIAKYPMVDVKASCYFGSYHAVDSSDMAFQVAASLAFKNVIPNCGPVILEPIMKVTVIVPSEYMGDIMGYMSSHRGRISGNEQQGQRVQIIGEVPQGEMGTFSRDLRSMTQGRSVFYSEFAHFDPCPPAIQQKVVEESKAEAEADD
jgi:elongation factor G